MTPATWLLTIITLCSPINTHCVEKSIKFESKQQCFDAIGVMRLWSGVAYCEPNPNSNSGGGFVE